MPMIVSTLYFSYYQRERYLYGNGQEPARKAALAPRSERNTWLHPANEWDKNGICPDQLLVHI